MRILLFIDIILIWLIKCKISLIPLLPTSLINFIICLYVYLFDNNRGSSFNESIKSFILSLSS